jgi:2,3-bisphosphoglycerate-independent phosphoglycerate mutase
MSKPTSSQKKAILVVLDGWGLNKDYKGNAITQAKTPNFDRMWNDYPTAVLQASGEAVGLPEGQMGNSEVGHFTIGAGKAFFQDLLRINKAVAEESLGKTEAFKGAFDHVAENNSNLHVMGMVSPGGVHSHQDHIAAIVKAASQAGVKQVYVHAFLDGRDVAAQSADTYVQKLLSDLEQIGLGEIATLSGRFYSMDRDKNWDRTDEFYEMVIGKKEGTRFSTPQKAIQASYNQDETDYFVKPCFIDVGDGEDGIVKANDAVIFANFRNDRMMQIGERFVKADVENLYLASMTEYNSAFKMHVAFQKEKPETYLGMEISKAGLKQLRITETEKFAHMTFFLNCQNQDPLEGEDRIMLDSNDVKAHDEKPEMRVHDITEQILQDLNSDTHPAIMTNLCNMDLVGHTGNIPAAIQACEAMDKCLGQLEESVLKNDYSMIVIADHGNADEMLDEETGDMITCHSTNPVPFILVSPGSKTGKVKLKSNEGTLIDVAPTMLKLLGLNIPDAMSGKSLV